MIFASSGKYRAVMCARRQTMNRSCSFRQYSSIHEEDNSGQSRLRPARSRGTRGLAGGPRHRRNVNQRAMGRAMPTCDCCLTEKADAQVKLRPRRPLGWEPGAPCGHLRLYDIRHKVLLASSVTINEPSCATATPTGRPQTLCSSITKPVIKSSYSPVGMPLCRITLMIL
jgi:hypothetical protein